MFDSWKFSKGIYLTIALTVLSGGIVIGYAHRQHRSSEILTGVIGGLTIILGMITAEWLRSAREQVELTRTRFSVLKWHIERYLVNFDEFIDDRYSHAKSQHMEDYVQVFTSLFFLRETTRWPQPNAKQVREVAGDILAKLQALQSDADENSYIWSLEDRMTVMTDIQPLFSLIWSRKPGKLDDTAERVMKYRKTTLNEGIPNMYTKRPSQ
jgi:hypothetical protein